MEAPTVQQILDSEARAASSEDYATAESLLREAARLQESTLGPAHPDLASTFNNLAVVCEKQNKLADAGAFYHRAFSIASASLDADHPLVLTSRENLDEFHRVHGRPDEPPTPLAFTVVKEPATDVDTPAESPNSRRRLAVVIGAAAALVLMGALAIWLTGARSESSTADAKSVASAVTESLRQGATENPVEKQVPPDPTEPRVVEASLCQSLSTAGGQWQCAPASDAAEAGSLYFYTRIATASSTRVHHRWYRNGRLRQDVDLAIQANPSAGYRTYSRQRLDSGDWRVEAVTAEGVVLHEARVAIR